MESPIFCHSFRKPILKILGSASAMPVDGSSHRPEHTILEVDDELD